MRVRLLDSFKSTHLYTVIDNDSSESESDESSEDDEKGSMAPKVADRFLELLPKIVQKHPDIYQDKKFFEGMNP